MYRRTPNAPSASTGLYNDCQRPPEELLIVDPREHTIHWLALRDGDYEPVERSGLIDLGAEQLAAQIDWP